MVLGRLPGDGTADSGGLVAKLCPTLVAPGRKPARCLCPWDSPGKNTGVGLKKEFIGPGLHLRPVHADHAWPPLQWTLNSVLVPVKTTTEGRIRPPPDRGTLKIVSRLLIA